MNFIDFIDLLELQKSCFSETIKMNNQNLAKETDKDNVPNLLNLHFSLVQMEEANNSALDKARQIKAERYPRGED